MTLRQTTARACRAAFNNAVLTLLFGLAVSPAVASPAAMQKGDRLQALPSAADAATIQGTDDQFHSLFLSWERQDQVGSSRSGVGAMAVPSTRPLNTATFTSGYGVRSDPFRGSAAMHAGIDLAAPTGTAVYATADGIVGRAQWEGGYGNMVEVDHGKGLATRFGHLSRILVHPGQAVHRGDLIALVGSTGRSTGPHLHYEVRIDGHAVNPVPFLQASDYAVALREKVAAAAQGGPDDVE